MGGLKGYDRTPRDTTRARRNSQRLGGDAGGIFGGALVLDDDGTVTLDVSAIRLDVTTVDSSPYAATNDDVVLLVDTTSPITINLPAAATGKELIIVKTSSDSNACTISPDGSEEISGESSLSMSVQYDEVRLVGKSGSGWYWI